jgi:hypothetical protein
LDLDSLLHGDTVWIPYYDSVYIDKTDTFYTTQYDTTNVTDEYIRKNILQTLQIPVIFGYNFYVSPKFTIGIHTGILLNIIVGSNYKLLNIEDYTFSDIKKNLSASTYFAVSGDFKLTKNINIFGNTYLTYPLLPTFSFNNYFAKYQTFGIAFGIKYYIK